MTVVFKPLMGILPAAQQRLWPELRPAADLGFALYGGTAIALRLGHRPSVDFDFFSEKPLDREALLAAFPFIAKSTVLQDQQNTFTVNVPYGDSERENVKVSFFGTIGFGRIGNPEVTDDGVLQVASLDDLMATKVKVILQRAEAKDYRDIAAMVEAGVSLSKGLSAARELYGTNFQPSESLKAMVYFDDGDLRTLTKTERACLVKAASAVRDLPTVAILGNQLTASVKPGLQEDSLKTHRDGDAPPAGTVFVFGSNLAGRHGAGAAKHAAQHCQAEYGVGVGRTGQSYAIPTKGHQLEVLPLSEIYGHVKQFIAYAKQNPTEQFYLSRVGCGLAGYRDAQIAPMFMGVPKNVNIPNEWAKHVELRRNVENKGLSR